MPNFREVSKQNWSIRSDKPTHEEINTGTLQRIADATEVMAVNFLELQADRDLYKRWHRESQAAIQKLQNRIRSLKGANTRLKNSRK